LQFAVSFFGMNIQLLLVPYDSGNRGVRMGAGPEKLLEAGLEQTLRDGGHTVLTRIAELAPDSWHAEIQSSFELMRMLSVAVREAREAGRFPIVLAGNCNTAVGTLAGLVPGTAVAWFDAHGDFNTPETTTSGFLDGTAVAIITGRCWKQLAVTVPGFRPVADERVFLIGTRDLDTLESRLLDGSNIDVIEPDKIRSDLPRTLESIVQHVDTIYVHLDLDVLDSAIASANSYALSGGLTLEDMEEALSLIAGEFRIAGVTLSAYDPAVDASGRAARAAIRLISTAARLAERA
jgi:arginase